MAIKSPFEIALAANYRVHGVNASVYVGGLAYTIRCIDKTDGAALTMGGAFTVDTVAPAVSTMISSITALGFTPIDLYGARVTINGNNWEVLTHLLTKTPDGGGEVYFTLRKLSRTELSGDTGYFTLEGQIAGTALNILADAGALAISMQDFTVSMGRIVLADMGDFDLSGQDIFINQNLGMSTGLLSLAGQDIGLVYSCPAAVGVFSLTPQSIFSQLNIGVTPLALVLSGQSAEFIIGTELPPIEVEYGSFVTSWQDVFTRMNIAAAYGAFASTGQDIFAKLNIGSQEGLFNLTASDVVTELLTSISHGSFTLTGQDALIGTTLRVLADNGSFQITGQEAALNRVLAAGVGSFIITGQDIAINTTSNISMLADMGEFALTGQEVSLTVNLAAAVGEYAVTYNDAFTTLVTSVSNGLFVLTGQDANFGSALRLLVDNGEFYLTGQDAAIKQLLDAGYGTFTVAGQSVYTELGVNAEVGTFDFTGQSVNILAGIGVDVGSYSVSGQDAFLKLNINAVDGSFVVSAQDIFVKLGLDATTGYLSITTEDIYTKLSTFVSHGVFTLTGQDVKFSSAMRLLVDNGSFYLTGQAAAINQVISAGTGEFTITGQNATFFLPPTVTLVAGEGELDLVGQSISVKLSTKADVGAFSLSGQSTVSKINSLITYGSFSSSWQSFTNIVGAQYGYWAGGDDSGGGSARLDRMTFASDSNASDVGYLALSRYGCSAVNGTTYGYIGGGRTTTFVLINVIDRVTYQSGAQTAADIGDLTSARTDLAACSCDTYGYWLGGMDSVGQSARIDRMSLASGGNAAEVSSYNQSSLGAAGARGYGYMYSGGGYTTTNISTIRKSPIDVSASFDSVGNLSATRRYVSAVYTGNYIYWCGGFGYSAVNTIDKTSCASDGTATDLADLANARYAAAGTQSFTNGYIGGGSAYANYIDKFSFTSEGNATDIADLSVGRYKLASLWGKW